MMTSVPQYVGVEDKVVGPLTWKQLFWMIGMGAALMLEYGFFDQGLFFATAIPTVLLFVAFAFYKPNGMPLTSFVYHGVLFFFRPKIAVWERPVLRAPKVVTKQVNAVVSTHTEDKKLSEERLTELARLLDRKA